MKKIQRIKNAAVMLLALSIWMVPLSAQTEEQIERFRKEQESYFNEKLELTPAEQEKFWPLYNDFYNRKIKLDEDERNTYKYCHSNVENMSGEEIVRTLEKIMQLRDDKYNLNKKYHRKFLEILPPKKVLLLYKVERDFRMHLIRQLRKRGRRDDNRRGSGGSPGGGPGTGPGAGMNPDAHMRPRPETGPGAGISNGPCPWRDRYRYKSSGRSGSTSRRYSTLASISPDITLSSSTNETVSR